jgi:hypothetical protein
MASTAPQGHATNHRQAGAPHANRDDEVARGCESLAFPPLVQIVEPLDICRAVGRTLVTLLKKLGLEGIEMALRNLRGRDGSVGHWKPAAADAIHLILLAAFWYGGPGTHAVRRKFKTNSSTGRGPTLGIS